MQARTDNGSFEDMRIFFIEKGKKILKNVFKVASVI